MKIKNLFFVLFLIVFTIFFHQNCSRVNFRDSDKIESVSSQETNDNSAMATPAPVTSQVPVAKLNSCSLPDGVSSLESGKGKIYFTTQADGIFCDRAEFRTCNDGTLSGSFSRTGCSIKFKQGQQVFTSCESPVGKIEHGTSMLFFNEDSGSCVAQMRSCDDGVLSGSSSYNKVSCRLRQLNTQGANCALDWNGQSLMVPHNARVIGFSSAKAAVESGQSCQLSTKRCDNGSFVGNASVASSCREKTIEELPEDSLLTGHSYNGSKVAVSYKISSQSQNSVCTLEYSINGSWFQVPNVEAEFNCSGVHGTVIKTLVDLSKIASFRWTETTGSNGAKQYSSQFRIRVNNAFKNSLKGIYCIKGSAADVKGLTPDIDEDCDGMF